MAGSKIFGMAMAMVGGLGVGVAMCEPVQAEGLTIGAAHSLKGAFEEILPMFESEYGTPVRVVYGPTQSFRRQIEKGAQIDVVLSSVEEIDRLDKTGLVLSRLPQVYARTSLVLVMSATSQATPISFHDVLSDRGTRIALGDLDTSSVGAITARALRRLDPAYRNLFHLIRAQHNEEVINLVHRGDADVGIVHRVDAIRNSGQVRIIEEGPTGSATPVQFGQAVVSTCRDEVRPVAEEFSRFIASPRIQKLLLKYGFEQVSGERETANALGHGSERSVRH